MKKNFSIDEYLKLLEPHDVSGFISILTAAVTDWLTKVDLSTPKQQLEEKLRAPDEKMQKLIHEGVDFSSRRAQIAFAAGLYKQRLAKLIRSSQPKQRKSAKTFARLSSNELEKISSQIANFALQLPFEDGLDFLAELFSEWILTCSEDAVRQDMVFIKEHWDEKVKSYEDMNELVLRWIVMDFPY